MKTKQNHHLLSQLLSLPQIEVLITEVRKSLQKEQKARLKFYEEITEQQKAEFINGKILIHSPVTLAHNKIIGLTHTLLNSYCIKNNSSFAGIEKILIQLTRNDYEPDLCFFSQEKAKDFTPDQKFFPAPDWIVEVLSRPTEKIDRGIKFMDYAAHGVQEYWIVDPQKESVEQYVLQNGEYELLQKTQEGVLKSTVIAGFEIPARAIFDEKVNLEMLVKLLK